MGSKTWGTFGNGSWVSGRQVDRPAPLGRNQPDLHRAADEAVARDDAPADAGVPDFLTGDRVAWLAAGGAAPSSDPGPHGADGPHSQQTSPVGRAAPDEVEFLHRDVGGHFPGTLRGAGGAAHGGLRADNATPWANPEGFNLGTDYDPVNMLRPMAHGRMRPALRGVGGPWSPETGTTSSPPPTQRGRRTSPFDPAAQRKGFGVEPTTARTVPRPLGDEPREAANSGTLGDGFMR